MVNIHIAGHNDFRCPVDRTVEEAVNAIRSMFGLVNGGIERNDEAMFLNDIITADGEYQFVNFQSQQAPVQPSEGGNDPNLAPLQVFWTRICEEEGVILKNEGFLSLRRESESSAVPKWGITGAVEDLYVRAEYKRLAETIRSNVQAYIFLRGTKGIGKSLFAFYLMYSIVKNAMNEESAIPSFLYRTPQNRLFYFSVANGIPSVSLLEKNTATPDYAISDQQYDVSQTFKKWHLYINSRNAENVKSFADTVKSVGSDGVELVMDVLPYEEILALSKDQLKAEFAYTVFGGSARMLRAVDNKGMKIGAYYDELQSHMEQFFEGSKFGSKNAQVQSLREKICAVIASSLSDSDPEETFHSLFRHTFIQEDSPLGVDGYASVYMADLASYIQEEKDTNVLQELRKDW